MREKMKKSVSLKINGKTECVVGYEDDSMITFQIGYGPKKGGVSEYTYYCHGFEWGDESYQIDFTQGEISERQKIEIEFGIDDKPTIKPKKNIVKDEKRCSFCNKLDTEVEILIEKNFLHRICNECINECIKVINKNNA